MRQISISILIMLCTCLLAVSCGNNKKAEKNKDNMEETTMYEPEFFIETSLGVMKIKLYSKTPGHRDNFIKLVGEKYYDGMRFHRVIENFMIQTGDPLSKDPSMADAWGTGGPEYTLPAEFVNEYWHKKGAIAAARKGDMANPKKASSGSQFYIVHNQDNCLHLDGQYTIFGEVVEGLDIVDKIATVQTDRYDRPLQEVLIKSIRPVVLEQPQADSTATADSVVKDSTASPGTAILPETMLINE